MDNSTRMRLEEMRRWTRWDKPRDVAKELKHLTHMENLHKCNRHWASLHHLGNRKGRPRPTDGDVI